MMSKYPSRPWSYIEPRGSKRVGRALVIPVTTRTGHQSKMSVMYYFEVYKYDTYSKKSISDYIDW